MILIGLGANQNGPWGNAAETLNTAIKILRQVGISADMQSRLIVSSPLSLSNQQEYVNAVISVRSRLKPEALLMRLHAIERQGGRRRARRWGPRSLDLDLLDWHGVVRNWPSGLREGSKRGESGHIPLTLPHPGIAFRPFVLGPIDEIAPRWRHPVYHLTAREMMVRLKTPRGGRILRSI